MISRFLRLNSFSKFPFCLCFHVTMVAALLMSGPGNAQESETCGERTRALIAGAELDEALRLVETDCPESPERDFLMGYLLGLPFYDAYDPERSHRLLMQASDAGHPEAQNKVAMQLAREASSLSDEQLLFAIEVVSQDIYERPFLANAALYPLLLEDIPLLRERGLADPLFSQLATDLDESIVEKEVGAATMVGIMALRNLAFVDLSPDRIAHFFELDAQQGLPEAQYLLAHSLLAMGQREAAEFWFALAHAASGDLGRPGEDFPVNDPVLNERIEDWYIDRSEYPDDLIGVAAIWCNDNNLGLNCLKYSFAHHERCEEQRILLELNFIHTDMYEYCRSEYWLEASND